MASTTSRSTTRTSGSAAGPGASALLMSTTAKLRGRRVQLVRQATASKTVRDALVSLAGLTGRPVLNPVGDEVGRVVDVVARLYGNEPYPPVTGLVVRVGRRRSFLTASAIGQIHADRVQLKSARMDLSEFVRRPGEVLLGRDVLDHQLVDVDGVQVNRAADLYLAPVGGRVLLVGVDVSLPTLLRRLGPKRWQTRATPDRVVDWQTVAPFAENATDGPAEVKLNASRSALHRLRPAELADLLEDLGRAERQQLLAMLDPAHAADALEEMEPAELENLLRESPPESAARIVEEMEPDEAAEALRDLQHDEREQLLTHIGDDEAAQLRELLAYPEDTAGGSMTTTLVTARREQTVGEIRAELATSAEHRTEIDAVALVTEDGLLLADIPLFDLAVAEDRTTMGEVADWLSQFTRDEAVAATARLGEVAERLVASRASSLLVVDDERRPVGRILADDVLDYLLPARGRLHFRRFLQ
ncbi:magnesium transporter MgtE N-terminal domain-containing protein [Streptacidiphilus jiangxiensis]|uniref:CBS domain-containing protein n=1 Tax=Streptacidiphilus jiangxiensis TaxID=235985 RepID=A0A1H7M1D0_STRJI|nr:CBS domain-containing protein [Streptacidiphilus jiangxiensis]SEL04994.1 CBS domain-containing protein [Streptacidiphilus jiangxiensis]